MAGRVEIERAQGRIAVLDRVRPSFVHRFRHRCHFRRPSLRWPTCERQGTGQAGAAGWSSDVGRGDTRTPAAAAVAVPPTIASTTRPRVSSRTAAPWTSRESGRDEDVDERGLGLNQPTRTPSPRGRRASLPMPNLVWRPVVMGAPTTPGLAPGLSRRPEDHQPGTNSASADGVLPSVTAARHCRARSATNAEPRSESSSGLPSSVRASTGGGAKSRDIRAERLPCSGMAPSRASGQPWRRRRSRLPGPVIIPGRSS